MTGLTDLPSRGWTARPVPGRPGTKGRRTGGAGGGAACRRDRGDGGGGGRGVGYLSGARGITVSSDIGVLSTALMLRHNRLEDSTDPAEALDAGGGPARCAPRPR
ncbi:hypothetical protein GCM10011583_63680 [Streptomyces camponoticapitis]|uniref:Uncharacterized protein n=1 Tax=Streptomyces camponoticapitis TaxID=1616125 RepID=A0ABQ2ES12_9ACTN|nr:hypothetical protein GCM10011583_63680 [Streptomyces camponoticapitis]